MVTPNQTVYVPGEIDSLTDSPVVQSERVGTAGESTLDQALLDLRNDIPDGSVGSFASLPESVSDNRVVIVGDKFWRGHSIASQTVTITPADDPAGGSDDRGYVRDSFGSIDHESQHPWLFEFRFDDDAQDLILRIESRSDPGSSIQVTGATLGTYTLRKTAGAGSGIYSAFATRGSDRYQYEQDVRTDPLELVTSETFTFRPASPITYWQPLAIAAPTDSNVGGVAFTAADQRKLAGVEQGATADQTPEQIKAAYESNRDTNAFTDADAHKLAGVEQGATADLTAAEVKRLYEGNADTNAFTDAAASKVNDLPDEGSGNAGRFMGFDASGQYAAVDAPSASGAEFTGIVSDSTLDGDGTAGSPLSVANEFTAADSRKLDGIEAGAAVNPTDAEIKAAYERNANTNAFTDARQTKVDAIPAQGSGNANRLLGYDGSGNYETTGKDWLDGTAVDARADARVQAAKGTETPASVTDGAGAAGSSDSWAPIDHSHPYEAPTAGDGGTAYTDAEARAQAALEIPDWTGQANERDEFSINRMPSAVQTIARAYRSGGPRLWPTTDIQIGGPIRALEYTGNAQARAAVFGTSATHTDSVSIGPATNFFMQFAKADFATQPTTADIPSNLRIRTGGTESYMLHQPTLTRLLISSATHWVFNAAIGITPADDPTIYLDIIETARLDMLPPDGSITASLMDGLADAPVGDVITTGAEDTFSHHTASARRELYNGTQGITVVNATRRSALSPTAFDSALNRETAGDVGLVFATSRRRLVTRSSTSISYQPDRVELAAYASGFVDLATLGSYPVYNGTTAIGDTVVAIPVYLAPAGTLLGHELVNIAADATSEDYESIAVFEPSAAHTQSTMTWSSSGDTKIDFDDFGAGVPGGGAGGQVRVYAAALPAAAGVPDNTVGIVINPASVAVKQTNITQGAQDTGWAGKTVDPHDLATARVGPYTLRYAASAGFQFSRNSHSAAVAAGGATAVSGGLPAGGRLVWSYETAGNGSSLLECDYTSDRAATGPIVFSVGSAITHTYRLAQANARAWDSGLLGVSDRAALLSGVWRATEPEGSGHIVSELWVPVNLGGGSSKGVLTRASLTSAVNLANPTQNAISSAAWTDVFSHTVTAAEAGKGFMLVTADVFATLALTTAGDATTSPDRGGDRPMLVVRLIKGTEEQGRNYRYFRFSGGVPLDCVLAEIIEVAAGDVVKVQAQMSRLTAAGTTLGAQVTTESHWARLSTSG